MATKYSASAQRGDIGVAVVGRVTSLAGGIYRPFENADIGVDGAIELLTDDREPSGDLVLAQVKSGPSYIRAGKFRIDSDRDHFETWSRYSVPVVGIVVDPSTEEARWVDITEHLRSHPEAVANGPFSVEAPASQPYSTAGFPAFVQRFRRSSTPVTRVDISPNLAIRAWELGDAVPTRAMLSAISVDYPDFDQWLSKKFAEPAASKKVITVGSAVAAFSMWQRKDERNIKLQTFMVGPLFRGTSIGEHLLYHEIRTWAADPNVERVYVTVASTKSELIEYFKYFGFRIEGIAANRYPRGTGAAELVMVKHFVRRIVHNESDLQGLAEHLRSRVWGIEEEQPTRFHVTSDDMSVPASFPKLSMRVDTRVRTVSKRIRLARLGRDKRVFDDELLMREFLPLRIHLQEKLYLIVPIFQNWVQAMLSSSGPGTPLKLRFDNVYYCYPKVTRLATGDLVIFYEPQKGGGRKSAIGCAVVQQVMIDTPDVLYGRFGRIGIYRPSNIRTHINSNGYAMAIKFGLFEPFATIVSLDRIRAILGNYTNVQGLTPITSGSFEQIRDSGLSP